MQFRFTSPDLDPDRAVCVDGVCEARLNLSHWPGHRTPPALRHDLSTGIALALTDAPEDVRRRLLDGIDTVTNNHFDTDGVLAAFVLLEPALARRHRDRLLAAATTGDFQVFTDEAALAIDLTLTAIGDDAEATLAPADPGADAEWARRQRQFETALAAVPALLDDPFLHRDRVAAELEEVRRDLDARPETTIEVLEDAGVAVLTSDRPLHRVAVNTLAGPWLRVLHRIPFGRGHLYRLHERVESWFDLVSRPPVPRRDWAPLGARLEALEAPESDAHWIAQPIASPVPELFFGEEGDGRAFGPTRAGALSVSRLSPRIVTAAVEEHYSPVDEASGRDPRRRPHGQPH